MPEKPKEAKGMRLADVVSGILRAVGEAKQLGDMESARVMELYRKEKVLSSFSVPAFSISDVEVELHFSIEEPAEGEETDTKIYTSPDLLRELEPHQVSVMKLKISPMSLRVLEKKG